MGIHAGLECGLIGERIPGMDIDLAWADRSGRACPRANASTSPPWNASQGCWRLC